MDIKLTDFAYLVTNPLELSVHACLQHDVLCLIAIVVYYLCSHPLPLVAHSLHVPYFALSAFPEILAV